MAESARVRPQFVDIAGRRLFVLHFAPTLGPAKGRVVMLPPLMEEMNRSRRLMAICCRDLCNSGYEVALPDLSGTGDSGGDFAAARWETWIDDLCGIRDWLAQRSDSTETLICVRAGSLFLPSLLDVRAARHIVAWQPVLNGSNYLQQVLRVRVMAERFAGGEASVKGLLGVFDSGVSVEVGGYDIAPELAAALLQNQFDDLLVDEKTRVAVIECKPGGSPTPSVQVERFLGALKQRHCDAQSEVLNCEQFWATQEIAAPRVVVQQTLAYFEQWFGNAA